MANKIYILMLVLLVVMFFAWTTLNNVKEPLKEIAQLPRCEGSDIVLTKEFMSNIRNFASDYIKNGTGEDYFSSHYQYFDTTYSVIDCNFVVKYIFTYGELHETMSMTIHAITAAKYEVAQTNVFLKPVNILITNSKAALIAEQQNISYDYYTKEVIIPEQTIVYRFYKQTLTQGTLLVLEIDAQSQQIVKIERPKELVPIV